jgi:hypothetical protein
LSVFSWPPLRNVCFAVKRHHAPDGVLSACQSRLLCSLKSIRKYRMPNARLSSGWLRLRRWNRPGSSSARLPVRPAPGPVQPAGPPVWRGQEPRREEEGDHRDRPHPAEDRLPGPQERHALSGTRRRLLHPAGITRPAPGIPAAPAPEAPPWLHHHHQPPEAALPPGP